MVDAPGVQVPHSKAEHTRQRLADEGRLRTDLHVLDLEDGVVFPVDDDGDEETFEFAERTRRPRRYTDLLDWSTRELAQAPRAFDVMGDVAIVKVPDGLREQRQSLGRALRSFLGVRVVFHDHGVQGEFRVRKLDAIAGDGPSQTVVLENGVRLHVDPAKAYFSPRLADERARIASLVQPGERFVDLFGGVAPQGVQAAKTGAHVVSIDLNPEAIALAECNATENKVDLELHCGDARQVAATLEAADRVVMNLPHGAKEFLDVAKALVRPGGTVHHHEILLDADVDRRAVEVASALGGTVTERRHVRNYSATEGHWVFDVEVTD